MKQLNLPVDTLTKLKCMSSLALDKQNTIRKPIMLFHSLYNYKLTIDFDNYP